MSPTCKNCRCTDFEPCVSVRMGTTCAWLTKDLCTFCAKERDFALAAFMARAHLAHELACQTPLFSNNQQARAARLYDVATGNTRASCADDVSAERAR